MSRFVNANDVRHQYGNQAEEYVASYLLRDGFTILARNYTKRCGEVDIIARKDELITCVEVKARTNYYFNLSEVITPSKQRKIIKTAQLFIAEQSLYDVILRFDVALVSTDDGQFDIQYIPNAFTKSEY